MPKHHRLTWNDKLTIEKMRKQKYSVSAIARYIGVHVSTIYRELKRGMVEQMDSELRIYWTYSPETSKRRHEELLRNMEKPLKIDKDMALAEWIAYMIIKKGYSPAAVCALMGKTPETTFSVTLCRQTVYKYIHDEKLPELSSKNLRYKGKRKRQYRKVHEAARAPIGDSIERRPEAVNKREEAMHWEMDCVESRKGSEHTLLVLTERVSRKELIFKMPAHTCECVVAALDSLEKKLGSVMFAAMFKSITSDNGHEFSDLHGIQRSAVVPGAERTHLFKCRPHSPGERGSNEKQNQMIRWHFPKGTDFAHVSVEDVQDVEDWLNDYPRKLLGWKTSNEVFEELLAQVA